MIGNSVRVDPLATPLDNPIFSPHGTCEVGQGERRHVNAGSLTTRTLSGMKWFYLATIGQMLMSLLILTILARLLTPAEFGLFGIAIIFVGLGEIVARSGLGPSIVQRLDLTSSHIGTASLLSVTFGVSMTALVWLLAPLSGAYFDEPAMPRVLRILSLVLVISGVGNVSEYLLHRQLRFRNLMVANLSSYFIGNGLVTIAMALLEFGVWSLVWGAVSRYAIHTLVVVRYLPPRRLRLKVRETAELLGYGAGFSLISIFNFVSQHSGPFVIGRFLGVSSLGYYTRAYSLILPVLNLGFALIQVLFPAMSERQQKREHLRTVYLYGVEALSLAALSISVLVLVSAREIVAVVLGEDWGAAVPVLRILAVVVLFASCSAVNSPLIRALGAVYGEAWRQAAFALLAAVGAWFGSRWGLEGVAAAIAGAWIAGHLFLTQLVLSLLGLRWRDLLRCHMPALWTGAWAGAALWLAAHHLRAVSPSVFVTLSAELLVWAAAVIAALWLGPAFVRPSFIGWMTANVRFDAMGAPGRFFHGALLRLERGSPRSE